jgi:hypothetical protein
MFGLTMALSTPKHVAALLHNETVVLGQACEHFKFSRNYLLHTLNFVYC